MLENEQVNARADFDAATARARQMFVAEQAAHAQDAAPANKVAPAKPRRTPAAKPLARTTKRTVREPAPA